jgi:hypothetical protein
MPLCILTQLLFGSAASLVASVGHARASRLIALAERGVQLSSLVAVEYIAVGVLVQPVFGRVYVWVDATQDTSRDTERTTQDAYHDTAQDARLDDFREQIAYLRQQLDEEREARRRADTIIAQLARANEEQARTIRELEAPSEPPGEREAPETAADEPERAEPQNPL